MRTERTERKTQDGMTGPADTDAPEKESIYGGHLPQLEDTMRYLVCEVEKIRRRMTEATGTDPVEHCLARIKSEDSMREKCRRKGLPETAESALTRIYDAVGVRVVCAFLSDVYTIRDALIALPEVEVVGEKDYIHRAKPNGYRSYHLILKVKGQGRSAGNPPDGVPAGGPPSDGGIREENAVAVYAEIQLRTISQDTWAALEHHMKYKRNLGGKEALIVEELKRCADELASTDISMQTLRDVIYADR